MPRPAISGSVTVARSNRVERLVDALADVVARPWGGPLSRELIVVPGRGMGVWLSMQLAQRLGVWMGAEFLYPRKFVDRALTAVLGAERAPSPAYERTRLVWSVFDLLDTLTGDPSFDHLRASVETSELRRFELAHSVAELFDRYLAFRPDMLVKWERGALPGAREERWQATLWRALVARLGGQHLAAVVPTYLAALATRSPSRRAAPVGDLPPRVSLFCPPSLPPLYVRVIAALARHVRVHAYLLAPALEHWGEQRRADVDEIGAEHPLLVSLGGLGAQAARVWQAELEALEVDEVELPDLWVEPDAETRLGRIQSDILWVRPHADAPGAPSPAADAVDASITVHACPSPLREVEALHAELCAVLSQQERREPSDVAVLVADLDAYAPLIDAVFGRGPEEPGFIPYRIVGRPTRVACALVDALLRLWALARGRVSATDVLDLLALEPVRRAAGIEATELDELGRVVREAGVCWGVDERTRAEHGQPPARENTWRFGLDRLLVGYAMPAAGRATAFDVLPFDEVEGDRATLVGRFAAFAEALFGWLDRLREPRALDTWRADLASACAWLAVRDPDTAWQHELVRGALADLSEAARDGGFSGALDAEVVGALLRGALDEARPDRGLLAGGVCFAAAAPLRAIPFPVVCLLGFGDGAFPRRSVASELDLMAQSGAARPCDPSPRAEDRYLFLESLLAARERLIITFTARGARDGNRLEPSSVVADLLDVVGDAAAVTVVHPLQPFDRRYFDESDPRLASYEPVHYRAARRSLEPRVVSAPLFAEPLDPSVADEVVEIDELARFLEAPLRYLLQRGLFVELPTHDELDPEREPLLLDGLERWTLGEFVLGHCRDGVSREDSLRLSRAAGLLPPAAAGVYEHGTVFAEASELCRVAQHHGGPVTDAPWLDRVLPSGVRLRGAPGRLTAGRQLVVSFGRATPKRWLGPWVRHLCLGWLALPDAAGAAPLASAPETVFVMRDDEGRVSPRLLGPAAAPAELLDALVGLYREGRRAPVPLFPRASWAYVQALHGGRDVEGARAAARSALAPGRGPAAPPSEAQDPYVELVHGAHRLPLDDDEGLERFEAVARAVFDPLLGCLQEPVDV